jgi:STAS domain
MVLFLPSGIAARRGRAIVRLEGRSRQYGQTVQTQRAGGGDMTTHFSRAGLEDRLRDVLSIAHAALSRLDSHDLLAELLERTRPGLAVPADDYKAQWVGQRAVIAMPIEIDAGKAGQIRQALLSAASLRPATLVIDMSGTTFCDSAGAGAIIAAHQQAAAAGDPALAGGSCSAGPRHPHWDRRADPLYPTLEAALANMPAIRAGPRGPGGTPASADPAGLGAPAGT